MRVVVGATLLSVMFLARLVIERDYLHWGPKAARRVVRAATALIPPPERGRWREEWLAEVDRVEELRDGSAGLAWSCSLLGAAARISVATAVHRIRYRTTAGYARNVGLTAFLFSVSLLTMGSVRQSVVLASSLAGGAGIVVVSFVGLASGRVRSMPPPAVGAALGIAAAGIGLYGPVGAPAGAVIGAGLGLAFSLFLRVQDWLIKVVGEWAGSQAWLCLMITGSAASNQEGLGIVVGKASSLASVVGLLVTPLLGGVVACRRASVVTRRRAVMGFAAGALLFALVESLIADRTAGGLAWRFGAAMIFGPLFGIAFGVDAVTSVKSRLAERRSAPVLHTT